MNDLPKNLLLGRVQAFLAIGIFVIFGFALIGPMLGLKAAESSMAEIVKNIMLLLVGYFFGSSSSSTKKDDAITAFALGPALPPLALPAPPSPDPTPAVPPDPPKE